MRDNLAERLLATVMGWDETILKEERPFLEHMADVKYDEYARYHPGMRFLESLGVWLSQFDKEDRPLAYDFFRTRLVFFSSSEIEHFVSLAFRDRIRPLLFNRVSAATGIQDHEVTRIQHSDHYKGLLEQCLFLGLSDGARVGSFRRNNLEISNEQVSQSYELSEQRATKMLKHLRSKADQSDDARFRYLILLDDFSASGTSYFGSTGGRTKGKIGRVIEDLSEKERPLNAVMASSPTVIVLLYMATQYTMNYLQRSISDFVDAHGLDLTFEFLVVQQIDDQYRVTEKDQIYPLLGKYFDSRIIDEHYEKGKHDAPHLGFDECALPVVLNHNTPNNSIPLIWFDREQEHRYHGLFPRVSRHRGAL